MLNIEHTPPPPFLRLYITLQKFVSIKADSPNHVLSIEFPRTFRVCGYNADLYAIFFMLIQADMCGLYPHMRPFFGRMRPFNIPHIHGNSDGRI